MKMKSSTAWFLGILGLLLFLGLGMTLVFMLFVNSLGVENETVSGSGDKIAVVELKGEIVASDDVVKQFKKYREDRSIRGILFRVDSPGGGVVARPLYALVRRQEVAGPQLTPLEQALAAVDAATRRQPGSAEHRESLAWLGRELRRTNLTELVGRARRLAWSEQAPTADASRQLTADVEAGRRNGA